MLVNLTMAAMGTNRNFLEIFFMSAFGKKTVKQSAYVATSMSYGGTDKLTFQIEEIYSSLSTKRL